MQAYKESVARYQTAAGTSKSLARSELVGPTSKLIKDLDYAGSMLDCAVHESRPSPAAGQPELDFHVKSCTDAMEQYSTATQATGSEWDPRAVRVASMIALDTCNKFKEFLQSESGDQSEEAGDV